MLFSGKFSFYCRYKDKKERIKENKEEFDLIWLKHQYYDLGRSIQEIADELNKNISIIFIEKIKLATLEI